MRETLDPDTAQQETRIPGSQSDTSDRAENIGVRVTSQHPFNDERASS